MKHENLEAKRELYFPSIIYSFQIPDADKLNAKLSDLIYSECERDQKGLSKSNFRQLGGWHSHNDLHKMPEYRELVGHVDAAGRHISDDLGYHQSHSLLISMMWSIINPPGSSNRAHIHPGSIWSGVYYIHASEEAGVIEFTDPRTSHIMNQPTYIPDGKRPQACWTKVRYAPTLGRMLIFPSWLYHSVDPNLSKGTGKEGERVIISFNIAQKRSPASW